MRVYSKERHPMGASLCFVFHRATTDTRPRDDREKKRAFFRPKTVKNHISQFNFRHNTCICQKKAVNLRAKLLS